MSEPILEHGERYGKLTVLRRVKLNRSGQRYRCGCVCGNTKTLATAGALMSGRVKECRNCSGNAIANTHSHE